MIGILTFKVKPNDKNEVEIGYGVNERYEKNGYMTEAVERVVCWDRQQNGVKYIITETENINVSSQKVLSKNNFKTYDNKNDCI
ncbi:MAG: GNAT family N-acetyltransferase [Bacilli bacterium]